jgi:hypothetical protein
MSVTGQSPDDFMTPLNLGGGSVLGNGDVFVGVFGLPRTHGVDRICYGPLDMTNVWERISELARFAPTPHNTQPYRLRPRSDGEAEIVLMPRRLLPVEDRENRYVYSALGIFAEAVVLAARAAGRTADVIPGEYPGVLTLDANDTVVAHVVLRGETTASDEAARMLLSSRRTSRLRYHPRRVDAAGQAKLVAIASSLGHRLKIESEPAKVASLLRQNAWAIIDNLQIRDDRREIQRWVRFGATPADGDGLWQKPLGQPAWELKLGFVVPWLFRLPLISHFAVWRFARTMLGTQHVALLSGPFRQWNDLIGAGTLLMRLWLEMASQGIYMHPFGSTLTNPTHARIIGERFGDSEGWLIFRLGYSEVPPASPRLPSVVIQ